jgi:ABC-2 type transport system ATP-binding protein
LAYISYGKLLAAGTASEVIAQAGLTTWELRGDELARASALLQQDPRWMVVAFGTTLHVSADAGADLPAWLTEKASGAPWAVTPIATGLEDVFISLTQHATDNFQ